MPKDLYSTIQVAKILGVSRKTVFQWARDGKIDATKVGRNYVIPHNAVLEQLGEVVGENKKARLNEAIDKALKQYKEAIKLLGEE